MKKQNGKSENIPKVTEEEITRLAQELLDDLPGDIKDKRKAIDLLKSKLGLGGRQDYL